MSLVATNTTGLGGVSRIDLLPLDYGLGGRPDARGERPAIGGEREPAHLQSKMREKSKTGVTSRHFTQVLELG